MVDYNILTSDVPTGGVAVAKINTFDGGAADDMATVRVVWKDHLSVTLSDLTWSGSTVTGAETSSIEDVAGQGVYQAKITIPTSYAPTASGFTFTCQVIATDQAGEGGGTKTTTFSFKVIPTTISISLDSSAVSSVIKRQCNLLRDVSYIAKGAGGTPADPLLGASTVMSLGSDIIYAIDAAYKNGSIIAVTTDYTWSEGAPFVKLVNAPAAGDFFLFRVQSKLSTTAIEDYISDATRMIVGHLYPYYHDSELSTYPTVYNLITDYAIARIRQDTSLGTHDNAVYRSAVDLSKSVMKAVESIKMGQMDILDTDGSVIEQRAGSIVGGNRHADGALTTRKELRERISEWDDFYLPLYALPAGSGLSE